MFSFDVVSSAGGRRYVTVRRMEDYEGGYSWQAELHKHFTLSHLAAAVLSLSLSRSALPLLIHVQMKILNVI